MSDTISIRRQRTVTFRTDCFAEGYDIDYFVRSNHGYYPLITDVTDGQKTYDVGYNPDAYILQEEPYNPFVCDELLLDWHGSVEGYTAITEVPYKYIEFRVPIIAIPTSALSGSANKDHIILDNDEYLLINSLYIDPLLMASHITGTKHENGQDISYDGVFENLHYGQYSQSAQDYRLSFSPRPHGAKIWYTYVNDMSLRSLFAGTSTDMSIWDVLNSLRNGAFVLTGEMTGVNVHHISLFDYYARDENNRLIQLLNSYGTGTTDYLNYVIPFSSYYEYVAAICSYYRWPTSKILNIEDWLNNR